MSAEAPYQDGPGVISIALAYPGGCTEESPCNPCLGVIRRNEEPIVYPCADGRFPSSLVEVNELGQLPLYGRDGHTVGALAEVVQQALQTQVIFWHEATERQDIG